MVTAEVLQRELGALRGDIHGAFRALSVEMHGAIGELRKEMHGARCARSCTSGLHAHEMHGEVGILRQEMHREFGAVRGEIAKMPFEPVKWLMVLCGIAAAITTTVYTIWFR